MTCSWCMPVGTHDHCWVTNLWQTGKVSRDTATREYIRAKKRVKAYLDNVDFHAKCETNLALADKAAVERALAPLRRARWRQNFGPNLRRRASSAGLWSCIGPAAGDARDRTLLDPGDQLNHSNLSTLTLAQTWPLWWPWFRVGFSEAV